MCLPDWTYGQPSLTINFGASGNLRSYNLGNPLPNLGHSSINLRDLDRGKLNNEAIKQLEKEINHLLEELIEREKSEQERIKREKKSLEEKKQVLELMTYDPKRKLTKDEAILDRFQNLNTEYITTIGNYLNKVKLKQELLYEIENEINSLRKDIQTENNVLKIRGELAITASALSDKILSVFSYAADYTGYKVAPTRVQFINDVLKEYITNDSLTVQWVMEQIYNYSSSNYLKNNHKKLLKPIESLYDISKLMNSLDENKKGYKKLQRESIRELNKLEKQYRDVFEEYKKIQNEFLNIPQMDIYILKNIELTKIRISNYKMQIEDAKNVYEKLFHNK